MGKLKLFIENMLVYGLGGVISKIIPLVMVPIITRLMPDPTYYGLSDLSTTVIAFAQAFAVMGMYDAMYRMFFEKDDQPYKEQVCSTALSFTLVSSAAVFFILLLGKNLIAEWIFKDRAYVNLVYLCAMAVLVGATNSIVAAPTRMQNKRTVFLVTNTVSPILAYAVAVPLLLKGYYVIALPLASLISHIVMEATFLLMNKCWFHLRKFDWDLLRQLLKIGVPAMPSFLIYWLFNSCDRLMIASFMNVSAEGLYAVGSKLGMASQLIYTAFAGGWQYFAFSTMKEKDQVKTNSMILEYLGAISFVAATFICAWSYPIYKLLFVGDYVSGYVVSPYLFLAPLIQMLFQVAGNQFLVIKKSWLGTVTLLSGAVLNILLNALLIPVIGIEGAAIATLVGYTVSTVVCMIILCRMKLMQTSPRLFLSVGVIVAYMLIWRLFFRENPLVGTALAIAATVIYGFLYRKDLAALLRSVLKKDLVQE